MKKRLNLDRIAFIGRTLREYWDMFGLEDRVLRRGSVLDCPAGPSSFTAEARGMGIDVTACDALYGLPPERLMERGEEDIEKVFAGFDDVRHLYTWGYYMNKEEVIALRKKALALFRLDLSGRMSTGRYVEAELPCLPFLDGAFSLVLSGHFLFLYGDRLNRDFHLASLREMLRVCSGEVRVFPLQGLDGRSYDGLEQLIKTLGEEGLGAETIEVPFEFQRGSNRVLRLWRK